MIIDPLPPINKVFSMVLQHERQFGNGVLVGGNTEPSVFLAKFGNASESSLHESNVFLSKGSGNTYF